MRKVVYCKNCGFLGSIEDGAKAAKCTNCENGRLFNTKIELDKWLNMSDDEKNKLKASWKIEVEKMDEQKKNDLKEKEPSKQDFYLLEIAENTRKVKNWIAFWSILAIILILGLVALGIVEFNSLKSIIQGLNL